MDKLMELEEKFGYRFRDRQLLRTALTHSSYANEQRDPAIVCNERLEFLGDAVLGFVTADYLYRNEPSLPEGEMTRMRADLVCETNLARAAERIGLGDYLQLGHGEQTGGGRHRASMIADATESVFAATYLDGGYPAAKALIYRMILDEVPPLQHLRNQDYKTALQELVQRKKDQHLAYTLVKESGPDHDKQFVMQVELNGRPVGTGKGSSKKRAEQAAAASAIACLFPQEAQ